MMSSVIVLMFGGIVLFVLGIVIFAVTSSNKTKQRICPGCKNNIQPNLNSCPYCGYILR